MSNACTVITGASRGIGECVAKRLIARGGNVLAVARDVARLEALCNNAPNARYVAADLARPESVDAVAKAVKENFGAVRGFVHCAGINSIAPMSLIDSEAALKMYALHAVFPMRFMGWIAKAPNHVEGASCVLVSSLACHEGDAGNVAYASSKGAVEGLLKSAAAELASRGVRVNAVAPGFVETDMSHEALSRTPDPEKRLADLRARYPFGLGTPEKVADVIEFFLGERAAWVTGQCLVADGGKGVS